MSNELKLQEGKQYVGVCSLLFHFNCPIEGYRVVQGCHYDGEHYYVAMNHYDENRYEKTVITVLDRQGEVVRVSEPIYVDHANCITYNAKKNCLVVSHCQSPDKHYNRYSFVDLDTLTVTETGDKEAPFFSMAYSAEKDMYVSGEWGGETLDYWDGDMNLVLKKDVEKPKTLSQGVFADGEYCYFVRSSWHGQSAEIRVYDWEGELKFLIPLQIEDHIEPENLNLVDGVGYILCNNTPGSTDAGVAYRMELREVE